MLALELLSSDDYQPWRCFDGAVVSDRPGFRLRRTPSGPPVGRAAA
jgi:hypothetical protein